MTTSTAISNLDTAINPLHKSLTLKYNWYLVNTKFMIFLHFPSTCIFYKTMNTFLPELYNIIFSSVKIYYVYSCSVSPEAYLFIHRIQMRSPQVSKQCDNNLLLQKSTGCFWVLGSSLLGDLALCLLQQWVAAGGLPSEVAQLPFSRT